MKSIGGLMFFFGVGSFVLAYLEREFIILAWIDTWGPTVAMAIKIGLIVVGGALWLQGNSGDSEDAVD